MEGYYIQKVGWVNGWMDGYYRQMGGWMGGLYRQMDGWMNTCYKIDILMDGYDTIWYGTIQYDTTVKKKNGWMDVIDRDRQR